jgi:hypothetical protein
MKFKVYHAEGIEIFDDFDDALIFVTVACSEKVDGKIPDIQITKQEGTKEIVIFKSSKIIVGENIYINEYRQKRIKCISCKGSGQIAGKERTMGNTMMGSCSYCAGQGYRILDEEQKLTTSGPFKVISVSGDEKHVSLDVMPDELVSVNCCYFDQRTAQRFAVESNKIKKAELKSMMFGHRMDKNNGK